ncbi:MAG: hypothetical protein K1X89_24805, partial [Myxococcaceae bacterium]|nr:hypothetical protein [Myxococcaceae bacterium]
MAINRSTVNARAAAVRSALSRADGNHDGRLSGAEQRRAAALVKGASDAALRESFKQARQRSGFVSVGRARALVALAARRALGVDRNRNGISGSERARLSGPIARALTQGAGPASSGGASAPSGSTTFGS